MSETAERVFEVAAEFFALLATPLRLNIICELYDGEKNVGELLRRVGVSQSKMSQHLGMLHRSGILGRRRAGAAIFYRISSQRALLLCEVVCAEQWRSLVEERNL